jgi:hypothetical protein
MQEVFDRKSIVTSRKLLTNCDLYSSEKYWGEFMGRSIKRTGLAAGMLILVGGCQNVGPIAIDAGRDRYNTAIQSTAKAQTLSNIIRVRKHDATAFTDVTEIAATTTASTTGSGTLSGIGSRPGTFGLLGSLTGSATYSESPLVRFVPLTGQGLVAQLVRPLTPDAIESLITSNWPAVAVLDLVALNLTVDQYDSMVALNIISLLASHSRVILVAGKSELTGAPPPGLAGGRTPSADPANGGTNRTPANDSLIIYWRPPTTISARPPETRKNLQRAAQLWTVLLSAYQGTQKHSPDPIPNFIELRTAPVPATMIKAPIKTGAPLLKTYSAIGILKNGTDDPESKISFVSRDRYKQITSQPWNRNADDLGFYMLLSEEASKNENPSAKKDPEKEREMETWIRGSVEDKDRLMLYLPKTGVPNLSDPDFVQKNRTLGSLRRYLLIIEDDDIAPPDAYVAYPYKGKWYYIDGKDAVSQTNFNLISLLLTVMSVPSSLPPITTTVAAGGGG